MARSTSFISPPSTAKASTCSARAIASSSRSARMARKGLAPRTFVERLLRCGRHLPRESRAGSAARARWCAASARLSPGVGGLPQAVRSHGAGAGLMAVAGMLSWRNGRSSLRSLARVCARLRSFQHQGRAPRPEGTGARRASQVDDARSCAAVGRSDCCARQSSGGPRWGREGEPSIRVNQQYRLTFGWDAGARRFGACAFASRTC